jgi:hypothetical protein
VPDRLWLLHDDRVALECSVHERADVARWLVLRHGSAYWLVDAFGWPGESQWLGTLTLRPAWGGTAA